MQLLRLVSTPGCLQSDSTEIQGGRGGRGELYLMLHCHRQHGPAVGWAVMEERELYLMLHCHRQHSSAVGWAVMGVSQFNGVLMWGSKPHGSVYETTQSGESGEPKRTHIDVCLHARFVPYCLAKQAHINCQMA